MLSQLKAPAQQTYVEPAKNHQLSRHVEPAKNSQLSSLLV
jgi:hypothetical protein